MIWYFILKNTLIRAKVNSNQMLIPTKIFCSCKFQSEMGDFSWNKFLNWNNFGSNQCIFKNEVPIDSGGFSPLI